MGAIIHADWGADPTEVREAFLGSDCGNPSGQYTIIKKNAKEEEVRMKYHASFSFRDDMMELAGKRHKRAASCIRAMG